MAKSKIGWRPWSDHPFVVAISLLAAVATIAAFVRGCQSRRGTDIPLILHVSDEDGRSVSGASALLFYSGGALGQFTDSNGVATFASIDYAADRFRLIVEHEMYEIYESQFGSWDEEVISVRLKERSASSSNVILRVVGANDGKSIAKAEISLAAAGGVFREVTDSDGFALFSLKFPMERQIDTRISVTAEEYLVEDQISTLIPGRLQYILLSPTSLVVEVPTFQTPQAQPTGARPEGSDASLESPQGIEVTYLDAGEGIKVVLLGPNGTPWDGVYVKRSNRSRM